VGDQSATELASALVRLMQAGFVMPRSGVRRDRPACRQFARALATVMIGGGGRLSVQPWRESATRSESYFSLLFEKRASRRRSGGTERTQTKNPVGRVQPSAGRAVIGGHELEGGRHGAAPGRE
jgi:hypothetical protein